MEFLNILSRINWVDILILILLFRISYIGFIRGLGSEIIPLAGIIVTLIISLHYYPQAGTLISNHTPLPKSCSDLICFITLVLLTKYLFNVFDVIIIRKVISIQLAFLLDKIGGLIFGVIRGTLFVSIVLIGLLLVPSDYIQKSVKIDSFMGRKFIEIGHNIHDRATGSLKFL